MKLFLNVYNPSEMSGFQYAYVNLTPELAKLILARRDSFLEAKQSDEAKTIVHVAYRDYSTIFLSSLPDGVALALIDDGGDYEESSLDPEDLENHAERTDCDRMVISDSDVTWTAYPHYADRSLTVEAGPIEYAMIEQIAAL